MFKGFSVSDAPLMLACFAAAVYWHAAMRRIRPDGIISRVRGKAQRARPLRRDLVQLEKRSKAASFMLARLLRVKTPCLARSCAVFGWALRMGLDARMCIGAGLKDGRLAGHAWVELDGKPFMEPANAAVEQTVMLEG